MRILTTLFATLAAALAGLTSAATDGAGVGAVQRSGVCTPHATVWTWPLKVRAVSPTPPTLPDWAVSSALAALSSSPTSLGSPARRVPQDPPVLRPFDPPRHRWDAGHRGVDLGGYVGEPVYAANSGVVLYAGFLVNRPVIVVGHGLLRTTYEPVTPDPSIIVGMHVGRGQRIGSLLAGHCPNTACLHWGLVQGRGHLAVYYDPLLLLGCGAVRLEPARPTTSAVPVGTGPRTG